MPVFISHTTADDAISRRVYDRLTNIHGIHCYIDDLDKEAGITDQSNRVTELIVNRLNACSNLLAIVTPNTRRSWWVPFEVGVARQAPRIITSFASLGDADLPKFLTEWPVLRGDTAIDTFAEHYKQQSRVIRKLLTETKTVETSTEALKNVNAFHRQLKAALGQ